MPLCSCQLPKQSWALSERGPLLATVQEVGTGVGMSENECSFSFGENWVAGRWPCSGGQGGGGAVGSRSGGQEEKYQGRGRGAAPLGGIWTNEGSEQDQGAQN